MNKKDEVNFSDGQANEYFGAATYVGSDLYYADWRLNGLYKVEGGDGEPIYLHHFGDDLNTPVYYEYAFNYGNNIWFIPSYSNTDIAIYNLEKDEVEYLAIPQCCDSLNLKLFCNYFVIDDVLWLAPCSCEFILKIDLESQIIKKYSLGLKKQFFDGIHYTFSKACLCNEKIILCPWNYNHLVVFDIIKGESHDSTETFDMMKYRGMLIIDEKIYLIGRNNCDEILVCDFFGKKINSIPMPTNLKGKSASFFNINEIIYCMPLQGYEVIKVDTKKMMVEIIDVHINGDVLDEDAKFDEARKLGKIFLIPSSYGKISNIIYDVKFRQLNISKKNDNFLKILLREIDLNQQ